MADEDRPVSPTAEQKPELTITAPAVNDEPAELDGTPASPEKIREIRDIKTGHKYEPSVTPEEKAKRDQLISARQQDSGVLVDVSTGTPTAQEFEEAEDVAVSKS